jgi:hypothetical protein
MQLLAGNEWVARLAYLSDIFGCLKQLNRKMQGKKENALSNMNKIHGFCSKLTLRLQHIAIGPSKMFPTLCSLVAGSEFICVTEEYLNALQHFLNYFDKSVEDFDWILHPFSLHSTFLLLRAQRELTRPKADRTLKLKFREISLDTFWLFVKEENCDFRDGCYDLLAISDEVFICPRLFGTDGNENLRERATKNH